MQKFYDHLMKLPYNDLCQVTLKQRNSKHMTLQQFLNIPTNKIRIWDYENGKLKVDIWYGDNIECKTKIVIFPKLLVALIKNLEKRAKNSLFEDIRKLLESKE